MVSAAMTIAVATVIAVVLWEAVNATMDRRLANLSAGKPSVGTARIRTLLPIIRTAFLMTLIGIVGLTVLSEVGINIGPLLAGAGIIGVAIGFGSQKLVQDLITGLFLLIENAMQVGDWVTVAGLSGSVENLSIRTIHLRAGDGSVHIIPFSAVTSVTNTNRGIGNAAVSVNVAIGEDIDRVCAVLKEIAQEIRQDPDFQTMVLSDLQLWGVDKVDAVMVTIVGQIVCTDSGRWGVQREYNRRLKIRFQAEGIEIANPAQTIIVAHPSDKTDHDEANGSAKNGVDEDGSSATPASRIKSPPPAALSNEQ
jgi:small-conductance mechanosensitive channel